ncbi:uncharacterized protein PAC_04689 [Phialocephala subalpina]|uniref:Uncharacterized protein n=1 Tax=Phialocephala subalpina TaxID=576137 RepID=A0A1L7WPW5_9HELO|nr:uncharacterized protein PAC_04689 [Phialocephala subalpina]
MIDTRQQHLSSLQVQISQITQNLIEENASLKKENDRLKSRNGKLVGMNTSLREENEKLKREHTISQSQVPKFEEERKQLTEKMTQLKSENSELKERVKLQEPLVECAVLIRRRLFERAKCQRGHGDAIEFIIEAGNHAAHRGDFFADIAMFKLGYMKSSEAAASQDEGTTEFERTYMKVFHDLYGSSLDGRWRTILIRGQCRNIKVEMARGS